MTAVQIAESLRWCPKPGDIVRRIRSANTVNLWSGPGGEDDRVLYSLSEDDVILVLSIAGHQVFALIKNMLGYVNVEGLEGF